MDPIEISAISLRNDLIKLDNISHNVANLSTAAYKKTVSYTESFASTLNQLQETTNAADAGIHSFAVPLVKTLFDHRTAAVKHSGNPLDLALEGEAYFELQSPEGSVYTKRGNFSLDSSGRMLLSGTQAVLNGVGGDIRIAAEPSIDTLGRIFENGQQVGQIKLVSFDDPSQLKPLTGGVFSAAGLSLREVQNTPIVRQGYLEASNTQPSEEMISLLQLSRHVEATQQVIQGYDEMLETTLNDLGNF